MSAQVGSLLPSQAESHLASKAGAVIPRVRISGAQLVNSPRRYNAQPSCATLSGKIGREERLAGTEARDITVLLVRSFAGYVQSRLSVQSRLIALP